MPLTFKQFLELEETALPVPKRRKKFVPKPIQLRPSIKPIATTDEPRIPSKAELALKAALQADTRNHGLKLADILGIYPAL